MSGSIIKIFRSFGVRDPQKLIQGAYEETLATEDYCRSGGETPSEEHCGKCPDICTTAIENYPTLNERFRIS